MSGFKPILKAPMYSYSVSQIGSIIYFQTRIYGNYVAVAITKRLFSTKNMLHSCHYITVNNCSFLPPFWTLSFRWLSKINKRRIKSYFSFMKTSTIAVFTSCIQHIYIYIATAALYNLTTITNTQFSKTVFKE